MLNKLVLGSLLLSSALAHSQGYVDGKVQRVQVSSDGTYGNCSATIDAPIANSGFADCSSYFVTFDCVGTWLTKSDAKNLLSQAQLGQVTGRTVRMHIDNTRKHRYCLAYRVDVLAEGE